MEEKTILEKVIILIGESILTESDKTVLLPLLIEKAKAAVIMERNYPDSYEEVDIDRDIEKYENVVIDLVIYEFNIRGAEFESSHNENGINRTYRNRNEILNSVVPFASVI